MPPFNPFVNDFNKLRNFSRIVYLYGCYSREDAENFNIAKRTFDDELRRMRIFLGEEKYLIDEKDGKRKLPCIVEDFFKDVENPLVNIYFSKTSTALQTTLFFMTLQVLNAEHDKKASAGQILDKISQVLDRDVADADLESSLKRILKQMQQLGIIKYLKDEKVYLLCSQAKEVFKDFSIDEIKNIYISVLFFINSHVPSVPGWYLKESLEKYLLELGEKEFIENASSMFWFTYVPHHYILEEELVWKFLEAASNNKKLKVWYWLRKKNKKTEFVCLPVRIVYDVKLGRWYFLVAKEEEVLALPAWRVEKIEILQESFNPKQILPLANLIEKCFFVSVPKRKKGFEKITIRFKNPSNSSYNFVLARVKRELKNARINRVDEETFEVEYELSNIKEFKGWLRSFGERALVLGTTEASRKLREEMINEWKEILKNYGDIS
ncbi:helix-turn-helix transcriptional regulator [Caldicellulosiruptor acetigenus]|uniref:helix-turn-helix transcriptional regulator n=1 Tax=Caldicellulosiruptor acetigenus TaxID=301953 RepID=UPI000417AFA5|nr:WYL domain-containing protein [Caldicellulosiruptor acetigenus]WAM36222.1 WYL domain-containing protein [Caldicellulosiruptor acetigenus]